MMIKTPRDANEFTVDWLNQVLEGSPSIKSARVTSCEAKDSPVPGQTAEIVLLSVGYDSTDPDLPTKMVAKFTSRNPEILEKLIANYDQYRRETSFYREFPDVGISTPECLYEYHDPATQEFVLLMRDLAPAVSPSWAATTQQVEVALSALPGFHAKWWNNEVLHSKDWMVQRDNVAFYSAAANGAHNAAPVLSDLFDNPALTQEVMSLFVSKIDQVMRFFESRTCTFVHGDFHAKQMFFPTSEGGRFSVIDWQFPFVAPGPWDFARMLSMCTSTEDRHKSEARLQKTYLAGLAANGIEDYSQEEFETDYRFGLIISQMIMAIAAADTDPDLIRIECEALGVDWKDAFFNRTQHAMADWDALSLLQQI